MGHGSSVQQRRNDNSGHKPAGHEESHRSTSASGAAKIECNRCRNVQVVECGIAVFNCGKCGAKVWVALSAVAEQAALQVTERIHAAEREIQTILEEQAAICHGLWDKLRDDLGFEEAVWESQALGEDAAHARALVVAAASSCDGAQVERALEQASAAGLPPASEQLRDSLARLRQEEDLETLWRCLARALGEEDRLDLQFWCDEAAAQGLCVPSEVDAALRALCGAEHARLAQLEHQAALEQRALDAHSRGDAEALRALASEARALGADASLAQAALAELSDASGGQQGQGAGSVAGGGPGNAAAGAASNGNDALTAEDLRCLDIPTLRAMLAANGMDAGAVLDREGLVQRLLAARAARARPAAGPPGAAPEPAPSGAAEASAPSAARRSSAGAGAPPQQAPRASPQAPKAPPPAPPRRKAADEPGREDARRPRPPPLPPLPTEPMTRSRALACLGLTGQPGQAELRRAYKQAALRWHPDRRQNHDRADEAKARFQEIRSAFELLLREAPA